MAIKLVRIVMDAIAGHKPKPKLTEYPKRPKPSPYPELHQPKPEREPRVISPDESHWRDLI